MRLQIQNTTLMPTFHSRNITNSYVTKPFTSCRVYAGKYGAESNFSNPLPRFYDTIKKFIKYGILKSEGQSTNKKKFGECYLTGNANIPLSTSGVHDCSVLYLYNKNTRTHALYHMLPETTKSDKEFYIQEIMPHGFTHASIILGDNEWAGEQEMILYENLELISELVPDAKINIYHDSSKFPEIVGHNGKVSEIKQWHYFLHKSHDKGHATFPIVDRFTDEDFAFFKADYMLRKKFQLGFKYFHKGWNDFLYGLNNRNHV